MLKRKLYRIMVENNVENRDAYSMIFIRMRMVGKYKKTGSFEKNKRTLRVRPSL